MSLVNELVQKIRRLIPDYRGYKVRESMAQDDAKVRGVIAQFIGEALSRVEEERARVGASMGLDLSKFDFNAVRKYDELIRLLRDLHMEVLNTPSGLMSIPNDEDTIINLIKMDYDLIETAQRLASNPSMELAQMLKSSLDERRRFIYVSQLK